MQERCDDLLAPGPPSALLFETPAEIYARVFKECHPRVPVPRIDVDFCRFANAHSIIRLAEGRLHVRITDLLEASPAPVQEALAHILLGKLFRRPAAPLYGQRYRLYLNRQEMRHRVNLVRQMRGRKLLSDPQGNCHNLVDIFNRLSQQYFHGFLSLPRLGWSRRSSRSMLGHFDPSHNAIVISRIFDAPEVPILALEYVVFHEMLHLRFPANHDGIHRRVHTREFQAAEREFFGLQEAKKLLRSL